MALGGFFVKGVGYVKLAAFGSALVILGLLIDSIVPSTSWLFLSFSIISGTGCGLLFIPSSVVLYGRLSGNMLPVAVGFAAAGGGAGTIVFNVVLAPLTEAWGWRRGRQCLAAGLLVLLTMNTLILRYCLHSERVADLAGGAKHFPDFSPIIWDGWLTNVLGMPKLTTNQVTESEETSEASEPSDLESSAETEISSVSRWRALVQPFGTRSFGLLSAGLVLYMGGFTVPYTHIVYYAELRHYKNAAMLVSILGVGSLVGRIACDLDVCVEFQSLLWAASNL